MNFHAGDTVVHWAYGLGQVIRLEHRDVLGRDGMYYAVKVGQMMVWVPADDMLKQRLRAPTSKARFRKLLADLTTPGEPLPMDRRERKLKISEFLKAGRVESLVALMRCIASFSRIHSLNDDDQTALKRARSLLAGEWGYALSVTPAEAETRLLRLMTPA